MQLVGLVRAGSRLVWRYALFMEIANHLARRSSFRNTVGYKDMQSDIRAWNVKGTTIEDKVQKFLYEFMDSTRKQGITDRQSRIGTFARNTNIDILETSLASSCAECNLTAIVLVDSLDEGYEPDEVGVGMIDGLVQAAIDIKTRISKIRITVFLRDNIFRSVQLRDPDYSRNIEGHTLRLHWNTQGLFTFASSRVRVAFSVPQEATQRVWNLHTAGDLKGKAGFERCLQLTLYRPRDLLSLLNEAFYLVLREGSEKIALAHIEDAGRQISQNRLEDLKREYEAILPGLSGYISIFGGKRPESTVAELVSDIDDLLEEGDADPIVRQDYLIMQDAKRILRTLYSVGFLGVRDPNTGAYVFCHDGRSPDREFANEDSLLVHPCYWMSLNCTRHVLDRDDVEQIYDEYDVEVTSEAGDIRRERIRGLVGELSSIDEGPEGAGLFEKWCQRAIRICFAKGLWNVELKPNAQARQRRDIVATNLAEEGVWKRIHSDYGSRQVVFEVKNHKGLESTDYYQLRSYLSGEYGRVAFFITRDDSVYLHKNKDVEWVRELYSSQKVLIVKLTGKYLASLLHKLRDPKKHDPVNDALHMLLDVYTRRYLVGQESECSKPKKRQRRGGKRGRKRRGRMALSSNSSTF